MAHYKYSMVMFTNTIVSHCNADKFEYIYYNTNNVL